jgi:hypothetical protein
VAIVNPFGEETLFTAWAIDNLSVGEPCTVVRHPRGQMIFVRRNPSSGVSGAQLAQRLEREADVLAQALIRVGAYPLDYPRTADGIRAWARAHAEAGTTLDKDGD